MRDAGIADRVMRELIAAKRDEIRQIEREIEEIERAMSLLWESVR